MPSVTAPAPAAKSPVPSPAATIVDNDLTLGTAGEGEQAISRSFATAPGTTAVRIRYRFITSEVPGGYFGSQYNDYFRVSLRSQNGGGFAAEANSMNGLGLGAFQYASGATEWREVTLQTAAASDVIAVNVAVANIGDGLFDSQVVIDFVEEIRDQVRPVLAWNSTAGGLTLSYTIDGGPLLEETPIEVYWADGFTSANRLGDPLFTYNVPANSGEGTYGPIHIDGNLLADDPSSATHLIAVASETSVGPIADVRVSFGPNANAGVVASTLLDIIKDGLRAAGQPVVSINSTARTPADQARAMFQNLTNSANSIQTNIAIQNGIYAAAGEAVIAVFANAVVGLTRDQIIANQTAIRAAMEAEIIAQDPPEVSKHCADPAVVSVVDVGASVFNQQNGPLFVAAVGARTTNLIDERNTNGCYHLELALQ